MKIGGRLDLACGPLFTDLRTKAQRVFCVTTEEFLFCAKCHGEPLNGDYT